VRRDRFAPQRPAVARTPGRVHGGGVEFSAALGDGVGPRLEPGGPLLAGQCRVGSGDVGECADDLGSAPRRPGGGQGVDEGVDGDGGGAFVPVDALRCERLDEVLTRPSECRCFVVPPCRQIGDAVAGLVGSGVDRCFSLQGAELPLVRVASGAFGEVGDLGGERSIDLVGALGEGGQQVAGHGGHLGLAVLDGSPGDAEAVREFVAQHRLVEAADHPLVLLQVAGVERHPASVGGLHLG